jgi:hypothetical protein
MAWRMGWWSEWHRHSGGCEQGGARATGYCGRVVGVMGRCRSAADGAARSVHAAVIARGLDIIQEARAGDYMS